MPELARLDAMSLEEGVDVLFAEADHPPDLEGGDLPEVDPR